MTFLLPRFLLSCLVFLTNLSILPVSSRGPVDSKLPIVEQLTDRFHPSSFATKMSTYYGASNIHIKGNGSYADIILDRSSSCGLVSGDIYHYGFFSASIRVPKGVVTSGVVVAFYMSNSEVWPNNHDEIDFEFLGHDIRQEWVLQTNIYGNGSVGVGREEKFNLWFDPTQNFHQYSILWNIHHLVFFVDNIPIREVIHNEAWSYVYPSKPMSLYTTIWDGSNWATRGGQDPVNYAYAPFIASLGELKIKGCLMPKTNFSSKYSCSRNSTFPNADPVVGNEYAKLSRQETIGLKWARTKFMFYSYCNDRLRFPHPPPECNA